MHLEIMHGFRSRGHLKAAQHLCRFASPSAPPRTELARSAPERGNSERVESGRGSLTFPTGRVLHGQPTS
jgi:hypothetical protein